MPLHTGKKRKLHFVTSNMQKVEEIKAFVGPHFPYEVVNYNLDLPELQGEIDYITIKKCQEAACRLKRPVLIEDSCLSFRALNGMPGPYIKWFLEKLGPEGVYKLLDGWEDKSAEAISTFAYCDGKCLTSDIVLFKGTTRGTIVKPRGDAYPNSWDSIFQPEGYNETFGEMPPSKKNTISQNFKAAEQLKKYFLRIYDTSDSQDDSNIEDRRMYRKNDEF